MIDLHCHILPGLDDGPKTIEESLEMARVARSDGIRTIVATPHTLNDVYVNPFQKVVDEVDCLRDLFLKEEIDLDLWPGSDVHICSRMSERILSGEAGTINGGGCYVLVEFPYQTVPSGAGEELFRLKLKGITPIITHPERNLAIQNRLETLSDMVVMGCLVQVTAMSITGEFGEEAMTCAHRLLDLRLAHVIATDAHSSVSRPPILTPAVEAAAQILGSMKEAEAMVLARPDAILAGEPVDVPDPKRPQKKKWWFRWGE